MKGITNALPLINQHRGKVGHTWPYIASAYFAIVDIFLLIIISLTGKGYLVLTKAALLRASQAINIAGKRKHYLLLMIIFLSGVI